jgi:D-glycero-alpha-D-manno-heptose-7-phosphate kinase
VIEATAPVRVCDLGGWTDTWFGGPGRVMNIAVQPGVRVRVEKGGGGQPDDPLVRAALDAYPVGGAVTVISEVPHGCGAGTSAAVAVALIGALTTVRNEHLSPLEVARAAHQLEAEVMGRESGVQDQIAAALGGINFIRIDNYTDAHRYPDIDVQSLPSWPQLDEHLSLVYLGKAHDSSSVHQQVIAEPNRAALDGLREAAAHGCQAVLKQDLLALGQAMQDNTDSQRDLHPSLIGIDASQLIARARDHGALGWKVNGAGGDGGSLTLLEKAREDYDPYRVIPLRVSDGLAVRSLPEP